GRPAAALRRLSRSLRRPLEDAENPPEPGMRQRLEAAVRGLERRADMQLAAWSGLLRDLAEPPGPDTVEWLALDRIDNTETDVAVNRNWVDPGKPFALAVAQPAHGLVVTSATLTDGEAHAALAWRAAEAAAGARAPPRRPGRARPGSPAGYPGPTRRVL